MRFLYLFLWWCRRSSWCVILSHIDVFFKKFRILLNQYFLFCIFLQSWYWNHLVIGFRDIYFHYWVFDQRWFVITKRNKNGLLIDRFRFESKLKIIRSVQYVFIQNIQIRIIPQRCVNQCSSIYLTRFLHLTHIERKWYKITNIFVVDYSRKTWLCKSHLFTHTIRGTLVLWVKTPSGRSNIRDSSSYSL